MLAIIMETQQNCIPDHNIGAVCASSFQNSCISMLHLKCAVVAGHHAVFSFEIPHKINFWEIFGNGRIEIDSCEIL